MTFKRGVVLFMTLLLFVIIWFFQSLHIVRITHDATVTMWLNNTAFGYSSMRNYSLFYPLPFLFLLSHFWGSERISVFIRSRSRLSYYNQFVRQTTIFSSLFVVAHLIVNLIFTEIYVNHSFIDQANFIRIAIFNCIGILLYFIGVALLFRLFFDLFSSFSKAVLSTFFLIGVIYFIDKLVFPDTWGPLKDLVIFQKMLQHEWTVLDLLPVYIRQLAELIAIYLIGSWQLGRRDLITHAN